MDLIDNETTGTLRILYPDESTFYRDFGKLFSYYYPNINIEIIEVTNYNLLLYDNKQLESTIEQRNPDIVMLNNYSYRYLSNINLLVNLGPKIKAEPNQNADDYIDKVIDLLMQEGGGSINGLAPFFQSRVLFYNKDLFDEFRVPYPTDYQTWDDIFMHAHRFIQSTSENEYYGFYHPFRYDRFNPFRLVDLIGEAENIALYDAADRQYRLEERHEQLFNYIINGLDSGAIFSPNETNQTDQFLAGNAAMRYEGYYYLEELNEVTFRWDIVSEPLGSNPSINYTMNNIFSIVTNSANQDLAWEFIDFITSDTFLKIKSTSYNTYGFPSKSSVFSKMFEPGINYEAFYRAKPAINYMYDIYNFNTSTIDVNAITQKISLDVLNGTITIDEAIDLIKQHIE